MRIAILHALVSAALLGGCASVLRTGSPSDSPGMEYFIVFDAPPVIEARSTADLDLARLMAGRLSAETVGARADARRVGVEALPFLKNSEPGRRFLALAAPRAISRGSPAELCPATGIAGGGGAATIGDAAVESLEQCLAALEPASRDLGCGCRVIAADDVLAVPREDVAYATGTTARLHSRDLGLDSLLVAEDLGAGETLLRDLRGPVGLLRHGPDSRVEMVLVGVEGEVFDGRSIPVGFRRGRLAERIYAEDSRGRQVSLLIGFSPQELAGRAGAWLAAPRKG